MSHSRMMAEHFGISILESDAKLLQERIQLLITEAYNRGVQHERDACAKLCEEHPEGLNMLGGAFVMCASAIRARSQQ